MLKKVGLSLSGLVIIMLASSAWAGMDPALDQTFGAWNVYTLQQGGKKTCYIASKPTKEAGTFTKRGQPYALVTHIRNEVDEFSVSSGYAYKSGEEIPVDVAKDKFMLFVKGELAWAYDSDQDTKMIAALKKGSTMTVKGTSQRETTSEDTYSLSGFSKAYDRMKEMCKK